MGAVYESDEDETFEWEVDYVDGIATMKFGVNEEAARAHAAPIGRALRRRRVVRGPWEVVIPAKSRKRFPPKPLTGS